LASHKEAPPARVFYFKVKVRLLAVVHGVGETGVTHKNVQRVPHAAHNFLTGERKVLGHQTWMVSLDNPRSVVSNVLAFESLNLQSRRRVQGHGSACRNTSNSF